MSNVQETQDAMLRAARAGGMKAERAEAVFAGLAQRIADGEAAPDPGPLPADQDRGMVWGPWLLGAMVGAAAVAALLVGSSLRGEASPEDNAVAAPYEAAPDTEASRASTQPRRTTAAQPKSLPDPGPIVETPAEPLPTEPAPVTTDTPAPAKTRGRTNPKPPTTPEPDTQPSSPTTNVAGEAQALGQAQAALDRDDLKAAAQALAAYRQAHPKGVLAPEAEGLAVLVECKRRTAEASDKAASFVRRHPRSALRKRIDSTCEKK